ncbi:MULTISPECIES: hypothetical protein [Microbacterium]|uniref:PIN domain-containing protein n=1 Tax=Microbacterium wangchenii TaxID=2541726 RepID=A0ABX5SX65_9MICO|nr:MULTISPECIES: hypothetical protein [Microbacterium]MCK6067663.1 hypothetical protein [Microbacterium sp. EYE_512]QBR89419.1 hypothetical protein E4K62_12460 [Microbacterium wangchenii]TFV81516.1 hypothetical protein E4V99_10985 [Microbacterium sp. dk485]TXK11092.1 type II toxin-antitoxin system VapC family toxin [Microbacterium wangchenii]
MTRYAVDAAVALRIVSEPIAVASAHRLVGPAILRSHALAALYRDVRAGRMAEAEGLRLLEGIAGLKIRLLGDRVSRATAWRIAAQHDWPDIALAEYLAVASLQADALLTDDPALAAAAAGIVRVAEFDELRTPDAVHG